MLKIAKMKRSNIERKQAITDIIQSVALEQAAIAHIINAEFEKLQLITQMNHVTPAQLLEVNNSIKSMINALSPLENVLLSKLKLFDDTLIPPVPPKFYFEATNLKRGKSFRTVDATFSYSADKAISGEGMVYYLLVKPGSPTPSAEDIIYFNNHEELKDGTVERGNFTVNFNPQKKTNTRVLTGREVQTPYNDETGVVDGYRYELYMVAQLGDRISKVTSPGISAIGMPFNNGEGTPSFPFSLREINISEMEKWPDLIQGHSINRAGVTETARMLDNIEGMVVLYENTDGLYGLDDTLGNSYLIFSDFDLSNYNDAYNGAGWRPIGNMNASLANGTTDHIFSGSITSNDTRRLISDMSIHQTVENTSVVAYAGLFGKVQSAVISDIDMTNTVIQASVSGVSKGYIGSLAGFIDGNISPIDISYSSITSTIGADNTMYVGTAVGFNTNCPNIKNISVDNIRLTAIGSGTPHIGGIVGGITPAEGEIVNVSDLSVNIVKINARGVAGGIFGSIITGGVVNIDSLYPHALSIQVATQYAGGISGILFIHGNGTAKVTNCTSDGTIIGGEFVGGIIGRIGVNAGLAPSVCLIKDCLGRAAISGYSYVGGLVGNASRATFLNCDVSGSASITDTSTTTVLSRPFGGLLGGLDESIVRDCTATVDVLIPLSSRIGGLIGSLTAIVPDATYEITDCSSSGHVSGISYTGGLIGGYTTETASITFERCHASGNVTSVGTGNNSTGGLIGAGKIAIYQDCYATGNVQGRNNVGGFIGDSALNAQFIQCYAKGDVTGTGISVAGFIGSVSGGTFERCFATGNVVATTSNAGGFVRNFTDKSTATDCYGAGNCQGVGNVAGFDQGLSDCTVTRCYASGNVTATAAAGGVVAAGFGTTSTVSNCFALNDLVSAGGISVYGRVVASSFALSLNNNSAVSTLQLMQNGVVKAPITSGSASKDGAIVLQRNLQTEMQSAGWDSDVWDFSTISTLGRPILVNPSEI